MPKKDNQQGYYGFDPSGLERAATVSRVESDLYRLPNIWIRVPTPRMPSSLPSKRNRQSNSKSLKTLSKLILYLHFLLGSSKYNAARLSKKRNARQFNTRLRWLREELSTKCSSNYKETKKDLDKRSKWERWEGQGMKNLLPNKNKCVVRLSNMSIRWRQP